ncbi:MAG: hypothetical protein Q4F95_00990 [Oscillospiraceae bacterium]|nr:hypothetical protein [Oscillospiraceae bacterium]
MIFSSDYKTKVEYTYYLRDGTRVSDVSYTNILLCRASEEDTDAKNRLYITELSDVKRIEPGMVITYTVILQNFSKCDLYNITITDDIGPDVDFIPGSVTITNQSYPDMNITKGIFLRSMFSYSMTAIQFKVRHKRSETGYNILNTSSARFEIFYKSTGKIEAYTMVSNTAKVFLDINGLSLNLKLEALTNLSNQRKAFTFTGDIKDMSDLPVKNSTLMLSVYPWSRYIIDTCIIDNIRMRTDSPIVIENLNPGEVKNITLVLIFNEPFSSNIEIFFTGIKAEDPKPIPIESNHIKYYY